MQDNARVIGLLALAALALALGLGLGIWPYRYHRQLARHANRDDWRGVRDTAARIVERNGWWTPATARSQAIQLLGAAHLILGDLPEARRALERALAVDLPAPFRAAAQRQLASVECIVGELEAARVRLARDDAETSAQDRSYLAIGIGMVALSSGDPVAAEQAVLPALAAFEQRLGHAQTPAMRQALIADLAQARYVLVMARIDRGDVDGAADAWAGITAFPPDGRPYVQGQLAEIDAHLAHARGDREAAIRSAEAAWTHYNEVGARVDLVRACALRARIARDVSALDAAETELRALGALGYLHEVEMARREIEGPG